jgi:hypothetical protein
MSKKFANQYRRSRNSYPGRAGGTLSHEQKAAICILAREAADRIGLVFHGAADLREWRCEQQFLAVGKESLTDCVQADYLKLKAWFLNLKGESGRAVKTHLRDAVQEKTIALHKLKESCADRGLKLSYAETICRSQFKCDLDQANAKQLWNLNFTVRNRAQGLS